MRHAIRTDLPYLPRAKNVAGRAETLLHVLAAGVLAALAVAGCARSRPDDAGPARAAEACALPAPVERIAVDDPRPGERHEVYELPDAPALWVAAPPDPAVERYRAAAAARLGGEVDPRALLRRQQSYYAADGDGTNIRAVLEGRAGSLGPAECLEMLLWREAGRRFPMLEHPTEFGAFLLRRPGRVRVYLSTADRVGQKLRGAVTDRVRSDVAAGWTLVAHLHNHPFLFDRRVGDRAYTTPATLDDVAGALAPSTNDVAFYRSWLREAPLQEARITNGFDSIRIPAARLPLLATTPEAAAASQ